MEIPHHTMNLLLGISAILLSLGLIGPTLANGCRCIYGQPCWPSEQDFSTLASQLSQPLLRPVPPASACYPTSSPSGGCADVTANYLNATWRSKQPGSMQNINFEAYLFKNGTASGCYLDVKLGLPCEQGSIPPLGVNATSAADIQAAVRFAKDHNLRLAVKNTGHDYLGRSTARGGFLIWTHYMKDMSFNQTFIPEGSPSTSEPFQAITLGAGVQWSEAYHFAATNNRFLVGGISADGSIGAAGGWVMGAGHSAFSPLYGLGVDNAIQFTIALADSSHVTTNVNQHPDLFWALRGGGGGTYGIVTSTTYQTHPIFPISMVLVVANFTSPDAAQKVGTEFFRLHPILSDAGWGGYSAISNESLIAGWTASNVSMETANTTIQPFVELVKSNAATDPIVLSIPFNSFTDWYSFLFGGGLGKPQPQVGSPVQLASRLLPRNLAEQDPAKVARITLSLPGGVAMNAVAGGAVSRMDPDSAGLNPSWRNAVAEVIIQESWPEGAQGDVIDQAVERLKQGTAILDGITVDSGSYLNEGSLHEVDFKKSFFGDHYSKLKQIKDVYDPTAMFLVASGVGSDEWDKDLLCRK